MSSGVIIGSEDFYHTTMNKKIIFTVAVVIVGGGVAGSLFIWRSDAAPYELATAERGAIIQEVSVSGTVEPTVKVDLQFKNSGELSEVRAEVGRSVKAGDVVAEQVVSVLTNQLRQSESELVNQEYKLRTIIKDETEKTDEEKNLINAQKALVEKAQADVKAQKAKIEETTLVSPIDGVITAVNGEVGEIAKPETIVVSIMSDDAPHIEVDVPETAIAKVDIGQRARITLDAFDDGTEWAGKVTKIDPAEIVKGGAVYYRTTVSFDEEDRRIRPGMTVNVWIETDVVENTILIPASAVQKKDVKKTVRILQENRVEEKEVVTGVKNDSGTIQIVSGVSEGDQVILGDKK